MGVWGTGLYQNDISIDVKDDYRNKLRAGKIDEEVYGEMMLEYRNIMTDEDEKYNFWYALGDTMWNLGRLNNDTKEKVLLMMEQDVLGNVWESQKDINKRKEVLKSLKEKLLSPMGAKKKISVHKPYITPWKEHDVYIMKMPNDKTEFKDWYIVIYVNEVREFDFVVPHVKDICPNIYIMLAENKDFSVDEISNLKFCCSVHNRKTGKKRYQYTLSETSNRKYPADMKYLGKCNSFIPPKDEMVDEVPFSELKEIIMWYSFVDDVVRGYKLNNQKNDK